MCGYVLFVQWMSVGVLRHTILRTPNRKSLSRWSRSRAASASMQQPAEHPSTPPPLAPVPPRRRRAAGRGRAPPLDCGIVGVGPPPA